jgi:hypothetical protein
VAAALLPRLRGLCELTVLALQCGEVGGAWAVLGLGAQGFGARDWLRALLLVVRDEALLYGDAPDRAAAVRRQAPRSNTGGGVEGGSWQQRDSDDSAWRQRLAAAEAGYEQQRRELGELGTDDEDFDADPDVPGAERVAEEAPPRRPPARTQAIELLDSQEEEEAAAGHGGHGRAAAPAQVISLLDDSR